MGLHGPVTVVLDGHFSYRFTGARAIQMEGF
jgi:hypothetical protein